MLIRNPAEFEHVARDWAVKYAGAPKKEGGEGSGGATAESIKRKQQKDKERVEKDRLAAYVPRARLMVHLSDISTDTTVTTKTS